MPATATQTIKRNPQATRTRWATKGAGLHFHGQKKAQIDSTSKIQLQQFASRFCLAWDLSQMPAMASVVLQRSSGVPRAAHTPSASDAEAPCKPVEGAFRMRGSEDWPHVTHCSTMATLHATNGCYSCNGARAEIESLAATLKQGAGPPSFHGIVIVIPHAQQAAVSRGHSLLHIIWFLPRRQVRSGLGHIGLAVSTAEFARLKRGRPACPSESHQQVMGTILSIR